MKHLHKLIPLAFIYLISSCQKFNEETPQEELQTLYIHARSAINAEIRYPVHLYAFDKEGYYVTSQIINNSEEKICLSLAKGEYQITAIGGLSNDYSIPERPNFSDWVKIKSINGASTPLMLGKAEIEITGAQTTLNITLTYAVSAISINLKGLPSDVSSTKVTLSPLHPFLNLHGEYGGEPYKLEIPCQLDTENIWSAHSIYTFPGSNTKSTISINIKKKDKSEETYTYIYSGTPQANHPCNIHGEYTGNLAIGGSFIVKNWEEAVNIEFTFGDSISNEENTEPKDEDLSPPSSPEIRPQVGDIWNNAIVVKTSENDVLLLSLEEWYTTTSDLEDILQTNKTWHIPTYDEALLLRSTFNQEKRTELNKKLEEFDDTLWGIDGEERYLCDKEGTIYSFVFEEGTTISKAGSKRSYYMRLLKWDKYDNLF